MRALRKVGHQSPPFRLALSEYGGRTVRVIEIRLTVAPQSGDESCLDVASWVALCQRCHLHHDRTLAKRQAQEALDRAQLHLFTESAHVQAV